mgnify:CR=1 FL=1
MSIKEFKIKQGEISIPQGHLVYRRVEPIEGVVSGEKVPGRCFLYDDYVSTMSKPEVFYEIVRLEVNEDCRGCGFGRKLVEQFMAEQKPQSVVLRAGILYEEQYNELREKDCLYDYIEDNIKPFWEKMGFVDVNQTAFYFEEGIPMLYPRERAEAIINSYADNSGAFKATNLF